MSPEVSQKVLAQIQHDKIEPVGKWRFVWRRLLFWLLAGVAVVLGGLSAGTAYFMQANQDWDIWPRLTDSFITFFLLVLPYFWIILFGIFVVLVYLNLRHTKYGYRWHFWLIAGGYVVITAVLGAIFYQAGLAGKIETVLGEALPLYHHVNYGSGIWAKPESGLLSGRVVSVSGTVFILEDLDGQKWTIASAGAVNIDLIAPEARLKIVGEKAEAGIFRANEIRSWCGCGGCSAGPSAGDSCAGGAICEGASGCQHAGCSMMK
ncbi:MAG: hypothetical protein PHD72_01565 [Patescibacteria group bacterium]|nr:hypothetical protein [Patescibacteria group bacterium]